MTRYDVVVIGSGPAGSTAALEAARLGQSVLVIERERELGGGCVSRGTIPSKTLQHLANGHATLVAAGSGRIQSVQAEPDMEALHAQVARVSAAHSKDYRGALEQVGVVIRHGKARLLSQTRIEIMLPAKGRQEVEAGYVVIATGSTPRLPPGIEIDHEHLLDSDSLLSLSYLPKSICVLGAGVIGCEYASIFAELGVEVTLVHAGERPMPFLDKMLLDAFLSHFKAHGGTLQNGVGITKAAWDGMAVKVQLDDGSVISAEKGLCALGRTASSGRIFEGEIGVTVDQRGNILVNKNCQTVVPGIYAVGDVVGAPTLASAALEEGRRAAWHICGHQPRVGQGEIPMAIFTLPALASVGATEEQVKSEDGDVGLVGTATWDETSRGRIDGLPGALKLVSDAQGHHILGVHIYGAAAADLIGIGHTAILSGWTVEELVSNVFCFPTLAEAYRVAALKVLSQARKLAAAKRLSSVAA